MTRWLPAGFRQTEEEVYADAYDAHQHAEPDVSDARDIGVSVGDFVRVDQPYRPTWTGRVNAVGGGTVAVWGARKHGDVPEGCVTVLVKREAME